MKITAPSGILFVCLLGALTLQWSKLWNEPERKPTEVVSFPAPVPITTAATTTTFRALWDICTPSGRGERIVIPLNGEKPYRRNGNVLVTDATTSAVIARANLNITANGEKMSFTFKLGSTRAFLNSKDDDMKQIQSIALHVWTVGGISSSYEVPVKDGEAKITVLIPEKDFHFHFLGIADGPPTEKDSTEPSKKALKPYLSDSKDCGWTVKNNDSITTTIIKIS